MIEQLESHRSCFPDGQLIVIEDATQKVVGLAFSLIIDWNDYSYQDNWVDFTSGGFFSNHNPRKGKTLYGAEVMVDPDYRGLGIGKLLYQGRLSIVERYGLRRIRAGARLRGYSKFERKLSPSEYTRRVIQREIYDPTLSFQLSHGFKVIDVAANYLYNDPESLGYAAVIEWLNPKASTKRDEERQESSVRRFLSGDRFVPTHLPRDLRRLVRRTIAFLGQSIAEAEGEAFYGKVEAYRERLKSARNATTVVTTLASVKRRLAGESTADVRNIVRAFSLQLEMINACEAAYRTWRLRQKTVTPPNKGKLPITYVLTAHPTEARSAAALNILSRLQVLLLAAFENGFRFEDETVLSLMRLLWKTSLTKSKRPTVLDEAEYISSIIFSPHIIEFVLGDRASYDLQLVTWVGGDKDGHPGVNEDVMVQCMNVSRRHILQVIRSLLEHVLADILLFQNEKLDLKKEHQSVTSLLKSLSRLENVSSGDGTRVRVFSKKFADERKRWESRIKKHHRIERLNRLLKLFPALVLPIELREDASLIEQANSRSNTPISGMLKRLASISGALSVKGYVRGLVISHCESAQDISAACRLLDQSQGTKGLPAIPLFETRSALMNSKQILGSWLSDSKNRVRVDRFWEKRVEVMLGYSDSSKQVGVLPSRALIHRAMDDIEKVVRGARFKPVMFHGFGGSVARGGGSLKEQLSWWPKSAIEEPKMTVQGEMVQRTFSTPEILSSQCKHMAAEASRRRLNKSRTPWIPQVGEFSKKIERSYSELVSDPKKLQLLLNSTPYRYLDALRIGSRPSKRPEKGVSVDALRAIPWVLCWTQTRSLLPSWWGVGAAWRASDADAQAALRLAAVNDPFFASFIKILGFTLAKVELDVWQCYAENTVEMKALFMEIRREYSDALRFIQELTGQRQLIWHRPWLEESIQLRSSYIHILNLVQIQAMENHNEELLRETIVGIACGMLTTG
jgi:phosphoenolpyruvate carboxylase